MSTESRSVIVDRIRHSGPIPFADFMALALYHPQTGYYATANRRSGPSGDFYTSVDVGAVFGELLAEHFLRMFGRLLVTTPDIPFDLVEAGAGNGRLSRDVMDALARDSVLYERLRLHLVERSAAARAAQGQVLGPHRGRLVSSGDTLPTPVEGVVFANELLDALPTHVVVARADGIREIHIDAMGDELVECELPPSNPEILEYLERLGAQLQPGWRAEVNLAAPAWIRNAAQSLTRGYVVLIDYGHDAATLFSASHADGTVATFTAHVLETHERQAAQPWLRDPGSSDITAHVNFTAIERAASDAGLTLVRRMPQGRFLAEADIERVLRDSTGTDRNAIARRLALKTLLVPGGLGSTHEVLVLAKNVI